MELNLPGGAGTPLLAMVAQWHSSPGPNDFAANLGQLKYVAKMVYDRLISAGYTDRYPWQPDPGEPPRVSDDSAVANLGQLKKVFSFDVAFSSASDGVPDWWKIKWFGAANAAGSGANDDFDGDRLTNLQEFKASMDPTDPLSWLPFVHILRSNNQTGLAGGVLSQPLVVQVYDQNDQPRPDVVVHFSVAANSGAVSWDRDSGEWASAVDVGCDEQGRTGAFYKLPAALGSCTIDVTAIAGAKTSAKVTFTATAIAAGAPANDNFAAAKAISGASGMDVSNNLGATREPTEPEHGLIAGECSVWYSWTAPADCSATFSTVGSSLDTLLAVYTGTDLDNLVQVAQDDDRGEAHGTSVLSFNAEAGTVYYIAVASVGGEMNTVVLSWNSNLQRPNNDNFATA